MERDAPQAAPSDVLEDYWLSGHAFWLRPLEWWVAWWNAWSLPIVPHPHAHLSMTGRPLTVPEPIASAQEQDLFA